MLKNLALALVCLFALVPSAGAVDITMTFANATPAEQRAAQWALGKANAAIAAENANITAENTRRAALVPPEAALPLKTPYANVREYLVELIKSSILTSWVREEAAEREQTDDIRTLWKNATDAQRAAAKTALGGS